MVCLGVTSEEASAIDQYICPPCSGTQRRQLGTGVVEYDPEPGYLRKLNVHLVSEY
jgi:hypothetical protein